MAKLILKPTGEDEQGRKTYVSVEGYDYVLKDGVIHSNILGDLHALSGDNGRPITERSIKICD